MSIIVILRNAVAYNYIHYQTHGPHWNMVSIVRHISNYTWLEIA